MYCKKIMIQGVQHFKLQAKANHLIFKKVESSNGQFYDPNGLRYDIASQLDMVCLPEDVKQFQEHKNLQEFIRANGLHEIGNSDRVGVEVVDLKLSQKQQDDTIAMSEEAINFILMTKQQEEAGMKLGAKSSNIPQNKKILKKEKGDICAMGSYLGNQIYKGRLDYNEVIALYPQFKDDIDIFLAKKVEEDKNKR